MLTEHNLPVTMVNICRPSIYDCICFVLSSALFLFCCVLTFYAIYMRETDFYKDKVPGWGALIVFVADLFLLAVVEGLLVALVELKRECPAVYRYSHPRAYKLGQTATQGDNMERFLMGRQILVIYLVFISAKLSTIIIEGDTILGIPVHRYVRQIFFDTGFLGCFVVAIFSQLLPEVVAVKFPVDFLDFRLMRPIYWLCVLIERTGLTHVCWLLAYLLQRMLCMREEEATQHKFEFSQSITAASYVYIPDSSDTDSAPEPPFSIHPQGHRSSSLRSQGQASTSPRSQAQGPAILRSQSQRTHSNRSHVSFMSDFQEEVTCVIHMPPPDSTTPLLPK